MHASRLVRIFFVCALAAGLPLTQARGQDAGGDRRIRWNVEHYPASWNVCDSLGEAYAKEGEKELAIANYEKSVRLYPGSPPGVQALKSLRGE